MAGEVSDKQGIHDQVRGVGNFIHSYRRRFVAVLAIGSTAFTSFAGVGLQNKTFNEVDGFGDSIARAENSLPQTEQIGSVALGYMVELCQLKELPEHLPSDMAQAEALCADKANVVSSTRPGPKTKFTTDNLIAGPCGFSSMFARQWLPKRAEDNAEIYQPGGIASGNATVSYINETTRKTNEQNYSPNRNPWNQGRGWSTGVGKVKFTLWALTTTLKGVMCATAPGEPNDTVQIH